MSKPRTKFYACGTVYRRFLQDLLTLSIRRGGHVAEWENTVAQHFGSQHAIAVPMARVGIYLCLRFFIQRGQRVLQSPYTLAEVINMTVCAGGVPHFSDVERENAHLDPGKFDQQENIGALLVTHLHGIPANMRPILEFAKARGVPVIEDAAQSAGAKYEQRYLGTLGDAGVFSFGMLKQLNCLYGGMVLTNNTALAEFIRDQLRSYRQIPLGTLCDKLLYLARLNALTTNPLFTWGMFPLLRHGVLNDIDWINRMVAVEVDLRLKHQIDDWYRHRLSPCQARMLLQQLPDLAENDEIRIQNAEIYRRELGGIPGLMLPEIRAEFQPTYAHFPIQVHDPANLLRWFNFYGQDIVAQHLFNCAELECFREFHRPCPVASEVAKSLILLPTYPGFGSVNVHRNVQILKAYFRAGQPRYDGKQELPLSSASC